jgi:hypothetical protein
LDFWISDISEIQKKTQKQSLYIEEFPKNPNITHFSTFRLTRRYIITLTLHHYNITLTLQCNITVTLQCNITVTLQCNITVTLQCNITVTMQCNITVTLQCNITVTLQCNITVTVQQ